MSQNEDQQNVALVSYVSPELLSRVQQEANAATAAWRARCAKLWSALTATNRKSKCDDTVSLSRIVVDRLLLWRIALVSRWHSRCDPAS
jgi:hypothetical protein